MKKSGVSVAHFNAGEIVRLTAGRYAGRNVLVSNERIGQMVRVVLSDGTSTLVGGNKLAKRVVKLVSIL